jgi:TDG/mug DNA glycosylase family protein
MRTKTLGEGKSVLRLPASLALLHHVTAVGEQVKVRLAPNPSQAWTQDRARDLIVGAGFELAGSCSLNQGAALVRIRRIQSLPDSVGPGMRVLIVGLNPSPYSADSGIPYGRPGNRFWPAALAAGLVSLDRDVDHALVSHHVGFTDLVRRTTRRADEVTTLEYQTGFGRICRLAQWLKPKVTCFVGLSAWRLVADKKASPGWQERPIGPSRVYVMPHTSGLNAHSRLEDLTEHLASVKLFCGE